MAYVSIAEAARRIGCTRQTAARVAVRLGIGVVVERKRIVAVKVADLKAMKREVKPIGNPNFGKR